jgi:hypothetical protein
MDHQPERQSIALALLAVLTGAIVQVTQSDTPFSPWQSIVGLIMVASAQAYGKQISRGWNAEAIAFAMIFAAGIVFSLGFVLEQALPKVGLSWSDPAHGEKPKPGFLSKNLEDDVYFVIWTFLTVLIFSIRRYATAGNLPQENGPGSKRN